MYRAADQVTLEKLLLPAPRQERDFRRVIRQVFVVVQVLLSRMGQRWDGVVPATGSLLRGGQVNLWTGLPVTSTLFYFGPMMTLHVEGVCER